MIKKQLIVKMIVNLAIEFKKNNLKTKKKRLRMLLAKNQYKNFNFYKNKNEKCNNLDTLHGLKIQFIWIHAAP